MLELRQARALAASGVARSIRIAANLSLRDAASVVLVSPSTILRWERGERVPSRAAGPAYARFLQTLLETS